MPPTQATDGVSVPRTPPAVLILSFLALVLEGYDLIVYGTVVPSLLRYRPWALTAEDAGHLGSLAIVGMLVGALAAAALTDRVGRRRILIASVTTFSLAMGLCAVAASPAQFGLFRFLVGIGAGGLMPTVVALVVEYSPVSRRGLNTAIAFAGVGVGGALAGLLAIWLVPDHGFRIMFGLGLMPLVVVLPLLWRGLPESVSFLLARGRREEAESLARRYGIGLEGTAPETAPETAKEGGSGGLRSRLAVLFGPRYLVATLLFWAATFLCLLVLFGANTWLPTLMMKSGYGLSSSLSFLLVLNLGAVAGTLVASPVADRVGSKPVVAAAFLIAAASLSLLALRPPVALVYLLVALAGVGSTGTQILLNTFVGGHYPASSRATGLGMSLAVGRFGGILGPTYGGFVLAHLASTWHFHSFAIPAALGAIVVLAVPAGRAAAGRVRSPGTRTGLAAG